MRFRKLRIAWSVVWGVAAVLLVVLWVRSYWFCDSGETFTGARLVAIFSMYGKIQYVNLAADISGESNIDFKSSPVDERHKPKPGFRWKHTPRLTLAEIPYWFVELLFAILVAVPWINGSRRFSLRTLLIATTLVAIVLELIALALR